MISNPDPLLFDMILSYACIFLRTTVEIAETVAATPTKIS